MCVSLGALLLKVRGQHYDLVLNGVEIGGGSVRVHDATMQEHIFNKILQVSLKHAITLFSLCISLSAPLSLWTALTFF